MTELGPFSFSVRELTCEHFLFSSTALYFPVAVTFMATTQGMSISPCDYVVVALLSTLATIGASPVPGSALVFVVMICRLPSVPTRLLVYMPRLRPDIQSHFCQIPPMENLLRPTNGLIHIGGAIHVPMTSMYATIVAIDWFIDRFRAAINAGGDALAAKIIAKLTGLHEGDHFEDEAGKDAERLCGRISACHHGRPLRRISSTFTI